MARQRNTNAARDLDSEEEVSVEIPTVVEIPAAEATTEPPKEEPLPRAPLLPGMAAPVELALVEAPLCQVPADQYRPRHIDLHLDHSQADTLKQLIAGLDARGDRLANGNRVRITNVGDAIRWLLDKLNENRG